MISQSYSALNANLSNLHPKGAKKSETSKTRYEALVEDYSYISEACATVPSAPDFTMTEEDRRAYQGLGDYFYDLDVDYDEE